MYVYSLGGHAKTARILIAMSIPGHLIFLSIIAWMRAGHTSLTLIFTASYLLVGVLQVCLNSSNQIKVLLQRTLAAFSVVLFQFAMSLGGIAVWQLG